MTARRAPARASHRGRVSVVVPLRSAEGGKSRLAGALDPGLRGALVRAMFRDVVDALHAGGADHVLVAAGDRSARALAASVGAASCADPARCSGLNDAVRAAVARVPVEDHLLVVMPDLPLLKPGHVAALTEGPADVTVVPARDGGTAVLGCRGGVRIAPAYGARSAAHHAAEATAAGATCARRWLPGLSLDVDTVGDVEAVLSRGGLGPAMSRLARALAAALAEVVPAGTAGEDRDRGL